MKISALQKRTKSCRCSETERLLLAKMWNQNSVSLNLQHCAFSMVWIKKDILQKKEPARMPVIKKEISENH